MPTYDYKCSNCGKTVEVFQSIVEERLIECPHCKKPALRRLIGTGAGLIFKGSGFYVTDYKNKHPSNGDRKARSGSQAGKNSSTGSETADKKKTTADS